LFAGWPVGLLAAVVEEAEVVELVADWASIVCRSAENATKKLERFDWAVDEPVFVTLVVLLLAEVVVFEVAED
jgi:hypothetical protein